MTIKYFFSCLPELIHQNLTIDEVKKIIKERTGIDEKNQRFRVILDSQNIFKNRNNFWDYLSIEVYDITCFGVAIKRNRTYIQSYCYFQKLFIDLNKKIGELKQIIFQKNNIPIHKQKFYLSDIELSDNQKINNINLFEKYLDLNISKELNDSIYIELPNSEKKKIITDLCNSGYEFLKEIGKVNVYNDYNIIFKDKTIDLEDLLIFAGIKNGDLIKIIERKTYPVFLKTLTNRTVTFDLDGNDTIARFKYLIQDKVGTPPDEIRLNYSGKKLENKKTVSYYHIQKESTVHMVLSGFF